ncbi:MAG: DegT/DnrJ/EryC1/StrS family aminotransferase [Candidatus Xenobia bacterium]
MTLAILGGSKRFPQGLPFSRPALPSMAEVQADVEAMLACGMVTKGQHLAAYEAELEAYTGAPHCRGVASCTSGLMLTLQALAPKGDVVVPSFSFVASFTAPRWNGLKLRFVDCDPDSFTVSVADVRRELEAGGVGAVLATYIFGNPPDIDALEALCQQHGVPLVFDAAHAFGALYQGARPGGRGDAEVFSTSATKLLATGEGGVVATRRADVDRHIDVGREYGNPGSYDCEFPGLNARLSEFHAILGRWSLRQLEATVKRRGEIACRMQGALMKLPGIEFQSIRDGCRSSFKDFAILVRAPFGLPRDALRRALDAEGIPTRTYFDPPGHRQTAFRHMAQGNLPHTDAVCRDVLCLPMHTWLSDADVLTVCDVIAECHAQAPRILDMAGMPVS